MTIPIPSPHPHGVPCLHPSPEPVWSRANQYPRTPEAARCWHWLGRFCRQTCFLLPYPPLSPLPVHRIRVSNTCSQHSSCPTSSPSSHKGSRSTIIPSATLCKMAYRLLPAPPNDICKSGSARTLLDDYWGCSFYATLFQSDGIAQVVWVKKVDPCLCSST